MAPCDAACQKIIINTGFMAVLASVLAALGSNDIHKAARALGVAASTYVEMLAVVGVKVTVAGDWEGCEQAQKLIEWITGACPDEAAAANEMRGWTGDIWSAIDELAHGKVPK